MAKRHLVCLMVSALSCSSPLSLVDADSTPMASSPALRPFGEALRRDSSPAVTLVEDGDPLFWSRPDLRGLLEAQARENPPASAGASPLTVLQLNVGLLDTRLLGDGRELLAGPQLAARRGALAGALSASGADLIALEEVWTEADVARLADALAASGYGAIGGELANGPTSVDGLMLLYRTSRLTLDAASVRHPAFEGDGFDATTVPAGIRRGYLTADFILDGRLRLAVYAVHTSPFPGMWRARNVQVRQLGLDVAARDPGVVAVVAGDMNAGLAYRSDVWVDADGKDVGWLYANASTWALAQHYGGLVDAFVRVHGALDDEVARAVETEPGRMKQLPYGVEGWCTEARRAVFTGSDCNGLYFSQYAGSEPPARLDHLWLRDAARRVHVADVRTVFTERDVAAEGGPVELSDHSGLLAHLFVQAP